MTGLREILIYSVPFLMSRKHVDSILAIVEQDRAELVAKANSAMNSCVEMSGELTDKCAKIAELEAENAKLRAQLAEARKVASGYKLDAESTP